MYFRKQLTADAQKGSILLVQWGRRHLWFRTRTQQVQLRTWVLNS